MTVPNTQRTAGPFVGAGTSGPFPFEFLVFAGQDLEVTRVNSATGERTLLTYGADYTVALSPDQSTDPGGTVTSLLGVGYTLEITSGVAATQGARITNLGGFYPQVHETALDKLTVLVQQLLAALTRTLRLPDLLGIAPLPNAAQRAGRILSFDSGGAVTTIPNIPGSGLELAALLADGASSARGAGLVAYNPGIAYAGGTVGAALADAAAGGLVVTDTVADLRAAVEPRAVAMTRGYWTPGDGGSAIYMLQPLATPSPGDNAGTVIQRSDGRWYQLYAPGETIPARQLGVYAPNARIEEPDPLNPGHLNRWRGAKTGLSGGMEPAFLPMGYSTTDWLMAANAQVRALGKALGIEGVVHCDKQVVVAAPTTWRFSGRNGVGTGNAYLNLPQSYLYQANTAMVGSVVCMVTHPGVRFFGGGILGPIYEQTDVDGVWHYPEGLARDGIFIGSNSFAWFDSPVIANMGRDAFRIGDYDSGPGTNANGVYLQKPIAVRNGRHAFHVSDASGSLDANAFLIESPVAQQNFGTGFLFGKTYLGGTVLTPKNETNGRGWFFDSTTSDIVVVGGNTEANVGWRYPDVDADPAGVNIEMAPEAVGRNFFTRHTVQGVVRNDMPNGSLLARHHPSRTAIDISNLDSSTFADAMLRLQTTAGYSGIWKRSAAVGGETFVGNTDSYPVGIILNGIIRWGFLPSGALTLGGFSDAGTPGQVLTSQGIGAAPTWSAAGGGSSPLTTKGDIYTHNSSVDARLAAGTDGHVLSADSTAATGLKWIAASGVGTVTSVALTVPTGLSVSGSPITGAGTLAVTWAAGYEGYTTVEKTKLAGLPATAVAKTGDTMTGDLAVSKADPIIQATASSGNANLIATSGSIVGGMRAGGGAVEIGSTTAHDTRILSGGVARITLFAAGNVQVNVGGATLYLIGLPTSSPGVPGAVWKDASGYLRIA